MRLLIILTIFEYFIAPTIGKYIDRYINQKPLIENGDDLSPIVVLPPTTGVHTGTVIFFHGSGWTGIECEEQYVADVMGRKFNFPQLKVIFPTAPLQPYTVLGGDLSHVWFDRYAVNASYPENYDSIHEIRNSIMDIIKQENRLGIPNERIVVGGISMGGAMAFYTGFGWEHTLAGVFALSSFLNDGTFVYKNLESTGFILPDLFQSHGGMDTLVPLSTALYTYNNLTEFGISGVFDFEIDGVHLPNKKSLLAAHEWVQNTLPMM